MTTTATPVLLDHALALAAQGLRVFPVHAMRGDRCTCGHRDCTRQAKHPAIRYAHPEGDPQRGKCQGECGRDGHGLHDATTGVEKISAWWARTPWANIAVATGEGSGTVVLDVDGLAGEQTLDELEQAHGALPETVRAITGGDGLHIWFAHPGEPVHNTAGAAGRLGPGLDFRGDGGYVVVPPSTHLSGQRYEWLAGRGPGEAPMASMPVWLLDRLREPPARQRPLASVPSSPAPAGGGTPYGLHALEQELTELRQTGEGGRNHALNRSAFNLGQLVAGGELDEGLVAHRLAETAAAIGLGAGETQATIRSGLTKGAGEPRTAPPREHQAPNGKPRSEAVNGNSGGGAVERLKPVENEEPPPEYHNTDEGNARRLVDRHGGDMRFCPDRNSWLVWDDRRWASDRTLEIYRRAKDTVRSIYAEALRRSPDERKELIKHALASEDRRRIENMISLARPEPGIPVRPEDLDADPWSLNCMNGTLNLRTGELRRHWPADLITRLAPVPYDAAATCPTWDRFLSQIMGGDEELVAFLRRAVGYSLTGNVGEQVLFFLHGRGANGKSTFLTTLLALLGDYGRQTEPDLLMARYGEVHPTGVADLLGARLAVTVEAEEGRRMAESLVKQLTGGDRIKARFMRQDFFEFDPTHKLWLAANSKPVVSGTDHAIWRRIRMVPFAVTIPPEEQDHRLVERLRSELPGILAWAVRGCAEWQRDGLHPPAGVVAATAGYQAEMDTFSQFLEQRCVIEPEGWITASDLYADYKAWSDEAGEKPVSQTKFGRLLNDRGFTRAKGGKSNRITWHGLRSRTVADGSEAFSGSASRESPREGLSGNGLQPSATVRDAESANQEELPMDAPACALCGGTPWTQDHIGRPLCKPCLKQVAAELYPEDHA